MKIAVFPGSFDPITKGHESIVRRALPLFDEIIVGIGNNAEKKYYFPLEKRTDFIRKVFEKEKKVKVMRYEGLTVDFCIQQRAAYILRGLRTVADFEFEQAIARMNRAMALDVETVFFVADPSLSHISSTIVRDILLNRGEVSLFVPDVIKGMMKG